MSVVSGYDKYKRYILTESGYKLISQWTNANTVVMDSGDTLQSVIGTDDISSVGNSITNAINSVNSSLNTKVAKTGDTMTGALITQSDTEDDIIEAASDGHSVALRIRGKGTTSTEAFGTLYLGNSTASGTAGNSKGRLRIYGSGTAYSYIHTNATSNRTQILPDKAGTFAMTSDLDGYLPLAGGSLTGNLTVDRKDGTTSAVGVSQLSLGNNIVSGTANNSRGQLLIYGTNNRYGVLLVGANTSNRTYTLPNANGTIALTSNLSSYLPLSGGTMTGNIYSTSELYLESPSGVSGGSALIWHEGNQNICIAPKWDSSNWSYGLNVLVADGIWSASPRTHNTLYSGRPNAKWAAVYAINGTIQTSDRNKKKDITELDGKYEQLFDRLKPVHYRMKEGSSGRIHVGFIAQDIEESMQEIGLTPLDFAGFCRDKETRRIEVIDEKTGMPKNLTEEDVLDENGNPVYTYSLRYDEFIAINTMAIKRAEKRIDELERRLESWTK